MFEVGKKYRNKYVQPNLIYECIFVGGDLSVLKSVGRGSEIATYNGNSPTYEEVKPTPDSIDWSHVHPSFKWLTRDRQDFVALHQTKPTHAFSSWGSHGKIASGKAFSSYKQGDVDWKDSLVERPEE